jgi:hypothetical protein
MTPGDNTPADGERLQLPEHLLLVALPAMLLLPLPKGQRSAISKRRPGPCTPQQRRAHREALAGPGKWAR